MMRHKSEKICLVTYPLNSYGGIQAVGRLVMDVLMKEPGLHLELIEIRSGRLFRLSRYLLLWLSVLRGYRPMFMHAYLFQACPASARLVALAHPIIWAHGIEVWGERARLRLTALDQGPELWAVSQFTAVQISTNWPKVSSRVVHLGVSTAPVVRKSKRCQFQGGLRLLTVSRFDKNERYKGHDVSLRALSDLKAEGICFHADFVGDGDDRYHLESLAGELGIGQEVVFHGAVNQSRLNRLYAEADLFLMPSQVIMSQNEMWGGEGFGLVYVEAAMHGVPSIAGADGGQADFIEHGITGWRVTKDERALVELLKHLGSHPLEIEECGRRCFELARQSFTREAFAERVSNALSAPLFERRC